MEFEKHMEIARIEYKTELCERTVNYAEKCSWVVGKHIVMLLRNNSFTDWEALFVALDGDNIIGFCSFMKEDYYPENKYSPWISSIFVDERVRGNRVSHKLIEYAEKYAKEYGFDKVYIPSNMIGFYEKCGYTPIDKLVNYGGDTDIIFVKKL